MARLSTIMFLLSLTLCFSLNRDYMRSSKQSSNRQVESTVIGAPVDRVWDVLTRFEFEKIFPNKVKSVEFTKGSKDKEGSTFKVTYVDGSERINDIILFDNDKKILKWKLRSTNSDVSYNNFITTIELSPVTQMNITFLSWTTQISGNVEDTVIEDAKEAKLDKMKVLRDYFN